MKITVRFRCPNCQKPWIVAARLQGKRMVCTCGHRFDLPSPPALLTVPVPQPVLNSSDFRAGIAEIVTAIGGLSMLMAGAGSRSVPADLEQLYQAENTALHNEKQQLQTRLSESEKARDDSLARCQRLEAAARRTLEGFVKMLKHLLPEVELVKDSLHFLYHDIEDCSHVLRVLYLLQKGDVNTLRIKAFKSAPGWLEIDKNISNGRSDDVRVYYRKKPSGGPFQVLVSRKGFQDQDKERLANVE